MENQKTKILAIDVLRLKTKGLLDSKFIRITTFIDRTRLKTIYSQN